MQDVTRIGRCLTILVNLTGVELLIQLWPVALRIGRLIRRFRRAPSSPEAMFEFESNLQELLREMARRIVQWTVNHLEPEDRDQMPAQMIWDGQYYRRRHQSPLRNLSCLFGPISLRRYCYQPLEACGRCLFPLEIQLGIVAGVATPALADMVARASADLTQNQLLDQLRQRGIHWGVRTLRKLTQAMAANLGEHRHAAQVQQLLSWLKQATDATGPRRVTLSVGRDGVMMPILKCQKYKEAAAATISVMNRWGQRIGTIYLGQTPESGQTVLSEQLTLLLNDVLKAWEGPLPRLRYVTDCGHHQTEYFERILSRMRNPRRPDELLAWEWIVDYYHACQYITKLAEAIFGPGRQAFAWAAKQRKVLKHRSSGCIQVLRSASALRNVRGLVGSEEDYLTAYQYLRQRAPKMDYRNYLRLRLPIGSGVTEAACKIVFTQRFKQSGMKWTIEGASQILVLRVIALSGTWKQVRQASLRSCAMPKPVTSKRILEQPEQNARKMAA